MRQDVRYCIGGQAVIVGVIAGALAGADDLEATGSGPIHVFRDQGRLIAPGQAVDHAGLFRSPRQQRSGDRVRLYIHHDHMLAVIDGGQAVANADARFAGGIDQHVQRGMGDQGHGVIADMGGPVLPGIIQGGGGDLFVGPARLATIPGSLFHV